MQYEPNLENIRHIKYTRADGLRDGALIPVENYLFDTSGLWEKGGKQNEFKSIKCIERDSEIGAAIKTSLETDACDEILKTSLRKFDELKKTNPKTKCLVVAKDIDAARRLHGLILSMNRRVEIATSADPKGAAIATDNFRFNSSEILVTCQMCYEGLDCKSIGVVCLLTNIRSKPWIEQAIARGTRNDPSAPPGQKCHLFSLQDKKMEQVLERIRLEDLQATREQDEVTERASSGNSDFDHVMPLKSLIQGFKWADLDTGKDLSAEVVKNSLKEIIGSEITHEQASEIAQSFQSNTQEPIRPPTPAERMKKLRQTIKKEVNQKAYRYGQTSEEINKWIKLQFGKPRADMNNHELEAALEAVRAL